MNRSPRFHICPTSITKSGNCALNNQCRTIQYAEERLCIFAGRCVLTRHIDFTVFTLPLVFADSLSEQAHLGKEGRRMLDAIRVGARIKSELNRRNKALVESIQNCPLYPPQYRICCFRPVLTTLCKLTTAKAYTISHPRVHLSNDVAT